MKLTIARQITLLSTSLVVVTAASMLIVSVLSINDVGNRAREQESGRDIHEVAQALKTMTDRVLKSDLTFVARRRAFQNVLHLGNRQKYRMNQVKMLDWLPDMARECLEMKPHYARLLFQAKFAQDPEESSDRYAEILVGVERTSLDPNAKPNYSFRATIQLKVKEDSGDEQAGWVPAQSITYDRDGKRETISYDRVIWASMVDDHHQPLTKFSESPDGNVKCLMQLHQKRM
jgi:hypothetical protein